MKPGVSIAIAIGVVMLVLVLLVQQRKLGAERTTSSSLRGDSRARVTAHYSETAELLKEIRELRAENEQLRRELEESRERLPTRVPDTR